MIFKDFLVSILFIVFKNGFPSHIWVMNSTICVFPFLHPTSNNHPVKLLILEVKQNNHLLLFSGFLSFLPFVLHIFFFHSYLFFFSLLFIFSIHFSLIFLFCFSFMFSFDNSCFCKINFYFYSFILMFFD